MLRSSNQKHTRPPNRAFVLMQSILLPGRQTLCALRLHLNDVSEILLHGSCNRFCVYFPFSTVRRLEPSQKRLSSFAGVTTSTANSHVIFLRVRPIIIEVLYGGAPCARGASYRDMAIHASFVSCSDLLFELVANAVCVGHRLSATNVGATSRLFRWLDPQQCNL